jgi:aldose 1-epimerase
VTAEFHAFADDPSLQSRWPTDFLLSATYELSADALRLSIRVTNPSERPLPWGLGVHPYFRVPLGGARTEDCSVQVPAHDQWELAALVPTGNRAASILCSELRNGRTLSAGPLDAVLHLQESATPTHVARLHDPLAERTLRLSFSRDFREAVVYTPPHREAVCIEPYTCCPDPFRLAAAGADAGGRVLPPGESWSGEILMQVVSERDPEDDQVWKRVHRSAC